MESSPSPNTTTINLDFSPYFRVVNGQIERFNSPIFTPPSDDPQTGVVSKDVVISPETGLSVRLFLPKTTTDPNQKLPLLVYIHGGAFCLGAPSSPPFHSFVSSLVARAKIAAVSVDYRLAPEHPLPIAYDDSWTALRWVVSHSSGNGSEPWLSRHADFDRVFLGGESAGANIANHIAIRVGSNLGQFNGMKLVGLILVHPYFGGKEVDELYKFMCPSSSGGEDDPRLNPVSDPNLPSMGCKRVLFCVAERDKLRESGLAYYEALGKSGWGGGREIMETEGEGHGFHLFDPTCDKAVALINRLVCFLNEKYEVTV